MHTAAARSASRRYGLREQRLAETGFGHRERFCADTVVAQTAPRQEPIVACGQIERHVIVTRHRRVDPLLLLPYQYARRVEGIQMYRRHFIGESVRPLQVHVVAELEPVIHLAVAFLVINHSIAGSKREQQNCSRHKPDISDTSRYIHVNLLCSPYIIVSGQCRSMNFHFKWETPYRQGVS